MRWLSRAARPCDEPHGFCERKAMLNQELPNVFAFGHCACGGILFLIELVFNI